MAELLDVRDAKRDASELKKTVQFEEHNALCNGVDDILKRNHAQMSQPLTQKTTPREVINYSEGLSMQLLKSNYSREHYAYV